MVGASMGLANKNIFIKNYRVLATGLMPSLPDYHSCPTLVLTADEDAAVQNVWAILQKFRVQGLSFCRDCATWP